MRLNVFFNLLFCFILISCSGENKTKSELPIAETANNQLKNDSKIDTSNIAIIKFDQTGNWPFNNSYKPALLSNSELIKIESLLKNCIEKYNAGLVKESYNAYGIDFQKFNYKLQYIPVINNKGEKEVWLNGLCNTYGKNWKKGFVFVKDGGNCYFNLKINLSSGVCYEIMVNGYA